MFVGHLAVGLALKRVDSRVPLGALLFAVLLPDALLGVFTLFGLEQITVLPSYPDLRVLLYDAPYSHGVAAAAGWTVVAFLGAWSFWESIGKAAVFAVAVLSHFILVALTTQQGIPLLGPDSRVVILGDGLPPLAEAIVEVPMVVAGLLAFLSSSSVRDNRRFGWAVAAGTVVLSAYGIGGHLFGPTPPDGMAVALLFIVQPFIIGGAAGLAESRLRRNEVLLQEEWEEPPDSLADVAAVVAEPERSLVFPPERIEIAERIWGKGCLTPGAVDQALQVVNLLQLSEANSLLFLGAGIGGGPRAVSAECGVWVNGFEAIEELVGPAMERSTMAGRARKAPIAHYDPETARFRERAFDVVIAFETFYTVAEKEHLFASLAGTLRPGGNLVFTDLVIAEAEAPSEAVRRWFEAEPARPRPWTAARVVAALQALPFEVRLAEDVTADYRRRILAGWSGFLEGFRRGDLTPDLTAVLLEECELWLHRVNALDDGGLRVYRFEAWKKRH